MRVLFHGPGISLAKPAAAIPYTSGTQHPAANMISEIRRSHKLTGNRGNMIHAEAPAKIFGHDAAGSAYGNLFTLYRALGPAFAEVMAENFDMIVISMANFIRADHSDDFLMKAIMALQGRVPFIVLGAGLQGNPTPETMKPSNLDLIALINERAEVFGLRGYATQKWLNRHGFGRGTVLGCPSLFAYPDSILGLDYASVRRMWRKPKILTAGYLRIANGALSERSLKLVRPLAGYDASYVFQDEIFGYDRLQNIHGAFNEGTSQLDRDMLEAMFSAYGAPKLPFRHYFYFMETGAWRQAARAHDVYIGDRFHGGVAALQAGIPGIFLSADNRVSELTDYFRLPKMSLDQFARDGVAAAIRTCLSDEAEAAMKARYLKVHEKFRQTMESQGLAVAPLSPRGLREESRPDPDAPLRIETRRRIDFRMGEDGTIRIGDVYGKYHFFDETAPLVICFSHLGASVAEPDIGAMKSPWAFDYLKKRNINCLCFAAIRGKNCFYRDPAFIASLKMLSEALPTFPERLGYGTSMGAYAVSAYATPLKISRLLIAAPISTRNRTINTWDFEAKRSLPSFRFDWSGPYNDGALTRATGYVVYDPFYHLDALHARRYRTLTQLKLPGAGHSGLDLLSNMKVLDWFFMSFYRGDVDTGRFYKLIRKRHSLAAFYKGILGKESSHLTPLRRRFLRDYIARRHPELLAQIPAGLFEPPPPAAVASPEDPDAPSLRDRLRRVLLRGRRVAGRLKRALIQR
ncbi:polysaccharide pyruvyl transferase family protein [Paenirhodobacter enshiensis]|uniref:polysaccharide pyruvyl transferase family protein n=1 Tax=Paenirhodobacter enshiensis TaxID=1105367 RepID=UPI0009DF8EB5|nr:polysaccharide pyruvyl transferase family protein [Paenirhodobacter enshiensis]